MAGETIGDFICCNEFTLVHEDIEITDVNEQGEHIGCGNKVLVSKYAARSIKRKAKQLGVTESYTVAFSADGMKQINVSPYITYESSEEAAPVESRQQIEIHGDVSYLAGRDINLSDASLADILEALGGVVN